MMDEEKQVELLKSENFTGESRLNRQSKRIVNKMFRYIRSFPFSAYDVEMMKKDIIGMAAETEKRGETLTATIGSDWKKFCDQLIDAMTDFEFPKGRKLLRASGIYHTVSGYLLLANSLLSAVLFLPNVFILKQQPKDILISAAILLLDFAAGIFKKTAGTYAMRYHGDASKADTCLKWGYGMLALQAFYRISGSVVCVLIGLPTGYIPGQMGFFSNWGVVLFELFWIVLFILGANKNKRSTNLAE